VPTARRPSHPRDTAADNASRAIRLFPTPAAPQITIPETSEAKMAASTARISSERPVNGHDRPTQKPKSTECARQSKRLLCERDCPIGSLAGGVIQAVCAAN
jgi:hypothetical protein